jgi:branched-chain amino acid transport system permease protein
MPPVDLWISAAQLGCFFGLIALAYYLTLVGAGFFNFAIGPYAMLAGLLTSNLVIDYEFDLWTSIAIGIVAVLVVAIATELLVVRPVQRRSGGGELPALVAVAAVLFAIQQIAGEEIGYTTLPGQQLLTIKPIKLGGTFIQPSVLLLVIVTAVAFAAIAAWVRWTRSGRLLRAVGDSTEAATLLGLPVNRIRLLAFAISGLVAAAAGLLFASKAGVNNLSGLSWAVSGFLAMVIGGRGSVLAPLAGGLILALVQVFVPYFLGGQTEAYATLVIALLFFAAKPEGLFVKRVRA